MKHYHLIGGLFFSLTLSTTVNADSTIFYDLTFTNGQEIQHKIDINGRWLRLESKPGGSSDYILMDTGRLLMFEVSDKEKSFQMTRLGRLYWPRSSNTSPRFKPVRDKKAVAGIRCQPVHETDPQNQPIARHCMSTGGPLGLNDREMITLSRLFMTSRRIDKPWPAVATADERQVSVDSESSDGTRQTFRMVKHDKLDYQLFRIPRHYQRLKPDLPVKRPAIKARLKP